MRVPALGLRRVWAPRLRRVLALRVRRVWAPRLWRVPALRLGVRVPARRLRTVPGPRPRTRVPGPLLAVAGFWVCAGLGSGMLAGCGGPRAHAARGSSPVARAQRTHEYPSPAPPAQRAGGDWSSPRAAIAAFADAYINWDATDVSADMRRLAAQSIGQARAVTVLAAAETAADYELQRGGIANSGSVEAIAPLPGHPDQYVVVTQERTTATATDAYQGLQPAWHVAIATVSETAPGRWVVSGWQPQS